MTPPVVTARPAIDLARCLVVAAGGERVALAAGDVAEVARPRPLTRVPNAPEGVLGVVSLRGTVLPVLCLARLRGTGRPEAAQGSAARMIVMAKEPPFGVMVDAVERFGDGTGLPRVEWAEAISGIRPRGNPGRSRRDARPGVSAAASGSDRPARPVLGFSVAGQIFGLDLADVLEVTPLPVEVAAVPDAAPPILGVADWRGRLLPLASGRALLGRRLGEAVPGRVIVVKAGGADVGLVVDDVDAILRVPEEAIEPLPPLLAQGAGQARVAGVCRLDGGRRLLSLLPADGLFDDGTLRRIRGAMPPGVEAGSTAAGVAKARAERLVVFELGSECFALPVAAVEEVVRLPEALARVPRAPAFVAGVMNLRGAAVPVIDAALRFAAASAPAGTRRRVVVIAVAGTRAGLIVDGVSEVPTVAPDALLPTPDLAGDRAGTADRIMTLSRGDRLIPVLSPGSILAEAERALAATYAQHGAAR